MKFPMSLGGPVASALAQAWAQRMEYLFLAHLEGRLDTVLGCEAVMREFCESPQLEELASRKDPAIMFHIHRIRSIIPVREG